MKDLEIFFNYIKYNKGFYCLNYKNSNIFSKNHFVKSLDELKDFVNKYKNKDCYITYNPLKTNLNRKTENVLGLNIIALDIEFINKQKPETESRMKILKLYIKKLINFLEIKTYLLVNSGNGYHLYIKLHNIIIKDLEKLKNYKYFVNEYLNKIISEISDNQIKLDDRKDLSGILRIPETMNTSANRVVKIEELNENGKNELIRKILFKYLNKKNNNKYNINLLENINDDLNIDLYEHPLVKIWLEPDLPDNVGKHHTLGFALQNLIFNMNLQRTQLALELQNQINTLHNINLNLNYITSYLDNLQILYITKKFAKEYYPKYLNEIYELINKLKS